MSEWANQLKQALLLVRDLRLKAVLQGLDAKAVRVALKYALIVDTYLSKQYGLTPQEDQQLDAIAQDLFNKTPQKRG